MTTISNRGLFFSAYILSGTSSSWAVSSTYFPALVSLLRASLEMTWPQMSFIGGLLSEVCCLRIGQANTEWYQHFFPRSISICSYRHSVNTVTAGKKGLTGIDKKLTQLTGNSSLCVQTPLHCLCSITCFMFISTGNAIQPDAKLQANKDNGKALHFRILLLFCSTVSNNTLLKIKW